MLLVLLALLSFQSVAVAAEVPLAPPLGCPAGLLADGPSARAWALRVLPYQPRAVLWLDYVVRTETDASVRTLALRRLYSWSRSEAGLRPAAVVPTMEWALEHGSFTDGLIAKRWFARNGIVPPGPAPSPAAVAPAAPPDAPTGSAAAPEPLPAVPVPDPQGSAAPAPVPASAAHRGVDSGVVLLGATYGGYVGGVTGYLVGEALEGEVETDASIRGIAPGAIAGGTIGGVTAGLLGSGKSADPDRLVHVGTAITLGGFFGQSLGGALIPPRTNGVETEGYTERIVASQLAGTMGGAGIAFLTKEPSSIGASLHLDLATFLGWQTGAGVVDLAGLTMDDPADVQVRHAAALGAGAGFLGVAIAANRALEAPPDEVTVGLALMDGLWLGGWSPYLFEEDPTAQQRIGSVRVGLGVGYATALLLTATAPPSPKSAALQSVGFAAGNALGAGVPLALGLGPTGGHVVGPMLAGGVTGQVLGAAVAPHYALSQDDRFLLTTLGAWTGYQVGGWAAYASAFDEPDTSRAAGYALTAGGAGTLAAMALAPAVDLSPAGSFELLAAGGWGSWYGGWIGKAAGTDAEDQWLTTLAVGDAGLVAAGVAQAAGWEPGWRDVGVINGGGALGTAVGGLVGVIALYDGDNWSPLIASTLVGTTAGLATGSIVASRSDAADSGALVLPTGRSGRGVAADASVRPWTDADGDPGLWLAVDLNEVRR